MKPTKLHHSMHHRFQKKYFNCHNHNLFQTQFAETQKLMAWLIGNIIKKSKAIEERKLNMEESKEDSNMHIFHCGEKRCWKAKL